MRRDVSHTGTGSSWRDWVLPAATVALVLGEPWIFALVWRALGWG